MLFKNDPQCVPLVASGDARGRLSADVNTAAVTMTDDLFVSTLNRP